MTPEILSPDCCVEDSSETTESVVCVRASAEEAGSVDVREEVCRSPAGHQSPRRVVEEDVDEGADEPLPIPSPPGPAGGVDRRSSLRIPVTILTGLAVLYTLYVARSVVLPVTLAALLALTLRPIIRTLRKSRLPDALSAGLTLGLLVVLVITGVVRLVGPAEDWVRKAPGNLAIVKEKLNPMLDHLSGLARTSEKVTELAAATEVAAQPMAVEIRPSSLTTNFTMAAVTGNMLGTAILIITLAYFLLAAGDRLLNNALSLFTLYSEKRKVVQLMYDVERGIAGYLLMVTCINAAMGVLTTLLFWLAGVPNSGLWGLVAFAFNYVPVFGPVCAFVLYAVVCLVTFDSIAWAMTPPLAFAALASLEGNVVTPMVMGRSMSLNPIVVFLSLIFWGWIWGLGGALLAVPLAAVLKIACEKFERTRPLAVLLGD